MITNDGSDTLSTTKSLGISAVGPEIPAEKLIGMLRQMLLIRRFDEVALELIWSKRIEGVVHPYIGQESSAVGICAALRDGDRVMSNHRGHGHCIAAGTRVDRMMAELFGRATGCCKGKGGSMHIADFDAGMLGANGIVGAGVPILVGAALSDAMDGTDTVSVAFFGDGATGQGIVFEALNLAALWKLPVVFVCENNGVASATPFDMTLPVLSVTEVAMGHGVSAEIVDGGDVAAVHASASRAVERLRARDGGPYLIECVVDRWSTHASRQVPMPESRDAAVLEEARRRDPIARLHDHLQATGDLDDNAFADLAEGVERELSEAIAFAESSPYPDLAEALEDVFA